ncbi:MAG: hypothetical protein JNM43_07615 [Planctomycetaceae bacterium]|nr:hypothetical protein [Planctomycetaceae bacterium]
MTQAEVLRASRQATAQAEALARIGSLLKAAREATANGASLELLAYRHEPPAGNRIRLFKECGPFGEVKHAERVELEDGPQWRVVAVFRPAFVVSACRLQLEAIAEKSREAAAVGSL